MKPIRKVQLICHRNNMHKVLEFQILLAQQFANKLALLSGADSKALGLVEIHADEIHLVSKKQAQIPPIHHLSKEQIITATPNLWKGTGELGPPVDFRVDQDIAPRHAHTHWNPVAK